MNIKFLNNLSLLKLAGYKQFALVDIFKEYVKIVVVERNENFFNIMKKRSSKQVILYTGIFKTADGDYSGLKNHLSKIFNEQKLTEVQVIFGVNEYKFLKIPLANEIEDIDEWLSLNTMKFIPEGRQAEEFKYLWKEYKKDESYNHIYLLLLRNDYLENILSIELPSNANLVSIHPFSTSPLNDIFINEINSLFLDFANDKVVSFYKSNSGEVFNHELFLDYGNSLYDEGNNETNAIDDLKFKSSIKEIKQTLSIAGLSVEDIQVYVTLPFGDYDFILKEIKNAFNCKEVNRSFEAKYYQYISTVFGFNYLLNEYGNTINFLPVEKELKTRETIEKQAFFKITIFAGMLLAFFLLGMFLSESYLSGNLADLDEATIESNLYITESSNLAKENTSLKDNLIILNRLKSRNAKYSELFEIFSTMLAPGSVITKLTITEEKNKSLNVETTGKATSQASVAETMALMDTSKYLKDVTLVFSSNDEGNSISGNEFYIKFKIKTKFIFK